MEKKKCVESHESEVDEDCINIGDQVKHASTQVSRKTAGSVCETLSFSEYKKSSKKLKKMEVTLGRRIKIKQSGGFLKAENGGNYAVLNSSDTEMQSYYAKDPQNFKEANRREDSPMWRLTEEAECEGIGRT
ncbi:hypothetical protein PsorP6_002438 [Peronosclerospora sorghi]|uniref:Uncharacterized protein n=1 Tax=Peronosclerospora sorghi TaxID=230839 RepID=A0ACC0WU63_9STRA|nr:hypothetical protein PsorP6_002438 [Peronosclerospora sorghi]